jgi:hypothetical protein
MPGACAPGARQAQTVHWTVCARALSSVTGFARASPFTSLRASPACRFGLRLSLQKFHLRSG